MTCPICHKPVTAVHFACQSGARGGAIGGCSTSPAKAQAARENGKRGGRPNIKEFREYLNDLPGPNHHHDRYEQRTRKYGDYLYAQDREKFMADMAEWLKAKAAQGKGETL